MSKSKKPLFGALNISKPTDITSHDVVDRIRELAGIRRVGHAGTLDPFATGVLVVAIGSATRLLEYTKDLQKKYEATFALGATSDTDDITGEVSEDSEVGEVGRRKVERALKSFIGKVEQTPPVYSAVKVKGKKLYEYARRGEEVKREPKTVTIHSIKLKRYRYPELELEVKCSSGTYIRALARDIGQELGVGAYVSKLRRTAIGPFEIQQSISLQDINVNNIVEHALPIYTLVEHLPSVTLTEYESQKIQRGLPIKLWRLSLQSLKTPSRSPFTRGERVALFDQAHRCIGIGQYDKKQRLLRPTKVL